MHGTSMLESFIVDYFPKSTYRLRIPLAGGELGNGLDMWRLLHIEYRGGNYAIDFGGVRRLQEFQDAAISRNLASILMTGWTS